jgi:hypothetical protein
VQQRKFEGTFSMQQIPLKRQEVKQSIKKVLRYVQGTKDLMLTYRGIQMQIMRETKMIENPQQYMCSLSQEGLFRGEAANSQ